MRKTSSGICIRNDPHEVLAVSVILVPAGPSTRLSPATAHRVDTPFTSEHLYRLNTSFWDHELCDALCACFAKMRVAIRHYLCAPTSHHPSKLESGENCASDDDSPAAPTSCGTFHFKNWRMQKCTKCCTRTECCTKCESGDAHSLYGSILRNS